MSSDTPAAEESSRSTSFRLKKSAEEYLDAVAKNNKSAFINSLLGKLQRGELVDAASIQPKEGQDVQCIFNLAGYDATKQEITQVCPVKFRVESLRPPSQYENLLTACRQCPRRQEHLIAIRKSNKSATEKKTEAATKPQLTYTSPHFQCKNGCGTLLVWTKQHKKPVEVETHLEHYCQAYRAKKPDSQMQPPVPIFDEGELDEGNGVHVTCSICGWSHESFVFDNETADRLLTALENHKRNQHENAPITDKEAAQLRDVQEQVRQKVIAK